MKEKMIKFLTGIGKKHRWLVAPVMGIIVLFLTIYHAGRKFFFDVRYHKLRMRTLIVAASLAVVCSFVVIPSLAEESTGEEDIVYIEEDVQPGAVVQVKEQEQTETMAVEDGKETVFAEEHGEEPVEQVVNAESAEDGPGADETGESALGENTPEENTPEENTPEETVSEEEEPLKITEPSLLVSEQISLTFGAIAQGENEISVTAAPGDEEGDTEFQYLWKRKPKESGKEDLKPASGVNTEASYQIPSDIHAGNYEYCCEVTAERTFHGKTARITVVSDAIEVNVGKAPLQDAFQKDPASVVSSKLESGLYKVYYDGRQHGIEAVRTSAYEGAGKLVVSYKRGEEPVDGEPKEAGTYSVYVHIEEGADYQAAPADVKMGELCIRYWEMQSGEKCTVRGTPSGQDKDGNAWYKETVVITPPRGYQISESQEDFKDSLQIQEKSRTINGVYLQHKQGLYISDKIDDYNGTYRVDMEAPAVDISFPTDGVAKALHTVTGGGAFRDTQKVMVSAEDEGSGVREVYYYHTTTGAVPNMKTLREDQWIPYEEFNITAEQAESTSYYIYAKAVDYAGNVGYASNENVIMDNKSPDFTVDGNVVSSEQRFVASEKKLIVVDKNLQDVTVSRADSGDTKENEATELPEKYDIVQRDGTKRAQISLKPPEGTGGMFKYFVTAVDASGNTGTIQVVMVDPVSEVSVAPIRFENQVYGYEDGSIEPLGFCLQKGASYTEEGEPHVTGLEIVEDENAGDPAFEVVDGTKIRPVNRLHAGDYTAVVRIFYNTDSNVTSSCSVHVDQAALIAEYRGSEVGYHTYQPDFAPAIQVIGFQYGESPSDLENQPLDYRAPVIQNFEGPAIELGRKKLTLGGGEARDYTFSYTDGFMNVVRRDIGGYRIHGTAGPKLSEEDDACWYTGAELTILPEEGYLFSRDDTQMDSFTDEGFVITEDTVRDCLTFYVMNAVTGEISRAVNFTYGKDSTPPEGKITIEESSVRSFFNAITFGNLFTDTVDVTIEASDDISGVTSVQYCVSQTAMDYEKLVAYDGWTEGDSFHITPEQKKAYVYARLTNGAGLVRYISQDEVVFDMTAPEISGVVEGAVYSEPERLVTVTDAHLTEVLLYEGEDAEGTPQSKTIDAAAGTCSFSVPGAGQRKAYTVVARDAVGKESSVTFYMEEPVYAVTMDDMQMGSVYYGYTKAPSVLLKLQSQGNKNITITDVELKNERDFVLVRKETGSYEVSGASGLGTGRYETEITVHYNGEHKVSAKYSFEVKKAPLTVRYKGNDVYYNEIPDVNAQVEVSGFVNGETADLAAGYEKPVIEFTGPARETVVLTPRGGKADNYSFEYIRGILNVTRRMAVAGTDGQYTVQGTRTENGWYKSDITITANDGYQLCDAEDSAATSARIVLNTDTDQGRREFYVKNAATGELYKKTALVYMRDTVLPVISGLNDGEAYTGGEKMVTVTDAYLASVTVNGVSQPVTQGSSTFILKSGETPAAYVIVARDRAGNTIDKTVVLNPGGKASSGDDLAVTDAMAGRIRKKAIIVSGAPTLGITSSVSDTAKAALSSDELKAVEGGKSAEIALKVRNIDSTVAQSEKELVIANLNGYTLGQYLDLTLFKTVEGEKEKQISELKNNIAVTINIPDGLLHTDKSQTRVFAVLRVHNGEVELLKDQDSATNTVTIFTKQFSTYALVYKDIRTDEASAGTKDSSGTSRRNGTKDGSSASSPATGDSMNIIWYVSVMAVAFAGMIVLFVVRRRWRGMDSEK